MLVIQTSRAFSLFDKTGCPKLETLTLIGRVSARFSCHFEFLLLLSPRSGAKQSMPSRAD